MKKKIALLLTATILASCLPMTALAASDNTISRVITVKEDTRFETNLYMDDFKGLTKAELQTIKLTLDNAEWATKNPISGDITEQVIINDSEAFVTFIADENSKINIEMSCTGIDLGEAKVSIDAKDSIVTEGSYKIANIVEGNTTISVTEKKPITESGSLIDTIILEEIAANIIKEGEEVTLRLSEGFKFTKIPNKAISIPRGITLKFKEAVDDETLIYVVEGSSTSPVTIPFKSLKVAFDEDIVELGDKCELTISGAGITKQTITVGEATSYGVTVDVKGKEMPIFFSGKTTDTETLKLVIKETVANSWIKNRKAVLTFPEGVEIVKIHSNKIKNVDELRIEENKVYLTDLNWKGKLETDFTFELAISPEFVGDIKVVLSGAALDEEYNAILGEVIAPVTVEAKPKEIHIDYRNTPASDIIITENEIGALEKGKVVVLKVDELQFDRVPTVKVEEGDIKIDNVKVKDGTIRFEIKTESQKKEGKIVISDVELYMERNIPAGQYDLSFVYDKKVDNALFGNYAKDDNKTGFFDIDEIIASKGYATVVTAGRDQGDSTFTTQVKVTIGSNQMYAGSKMISIDTAPYISENYTMLPVRAVAEALSDKAIVRWDDTTKTVTITFGQRVISMTVGSKVMVINGVEVPMAKACEITNDRTFLPLRDLGYALGLNDNKITWDDITKTATLN